MTARLQYVIVGGSAAGVSAAVGLRNGGFEGGITVVDAGVDLPYERPPLSKNFENLDIPRLIVEESTYSQLDIELVLGARVAKVVPEHGVVNLEGGESLAADQVLLATGVSAKRLAVPGSALENVLTLRDLSDARAMAARLKAGGPLVIVGGGFIGLEAAAVARERGLDVTVVEVSPVVSSGALGVEVGRRLERMHIDRGVRVLTGRTVSEFRGDGQVEQVVLDDGTLLGAATVLCGCGVTPNDGLARDAGVMTSAGVPVDAYGRTDVANIWAAGDVAAQYSRFTRRSERIEHWNVALLDGTSVGTSMAGKLSTQDEPPYFWSDQYDHRLQMYGRARPGDDLVWRRGGAGEGFLAFRLRKGRVVAAVALDQPKELRAAKRLVEDMALVRTADLADPDVALKSLWLGPRR